MPSNSTYKIRIHPNPFGGFFIVQMYKDDEIIGSVREAEDGLKFWKSLFPIYAGNDKDSGVSGQELPDSDG